MRRQEGFSYVIAMFLVAALSLAAVRALESTKVAEQRDREIELLWCGIAYRDAIHDYYENAPGSIHTHPETVAELLYDSRFTNPRRHLRKAYRDPMAADGVWELLRNEDGRVTGVRSRSAVAPLKRAGFPEGFDSFAQARRYSDWQFVYIPERKPQ